MKGFSPRTLVAQRHKGGSLTQPRIDRAVRRLQRDGWVLAYHPSVTEPDRPVVAEREDHPFADLMRWTYPASMGNPRKMADVCRVSLEGVTGHPAGSRESLETLARRGLAVMQVRDPLTWLRGTSPQLASVVNRLRLGRQSRGGWCTYRLVQAALGLAEPPIRLSDNRLVAAAEMFEAFHVDASDLLERRRRTHMRSRWFLDDAGPAKAVA